MKNLTLANFSEKPFEVIDAVHRNDEMFQDAGHYYGAAVDAINIIVRELAAAKIPIDKVNRIMDCPSGYGRVARMLRAVFPKSEIVATDILEEGIKFCAEAFGCVPVLAKVNPFESEVTGAFDLIWSGSLVTHLNAKQTERYIDFWLQHLAPSGIVVFSTLGRYNYERFKDGTYLHYLPPSEAKKLVEGYEVSGLGYGAHTREYNEKDVPITKLVLDELEYTDWGVTAIKPQWLYSFIDQDKYKGKYRILSHHETYWDENHDIVTIQRIPEGFGWNRNK